VVLLRAENDEQTPAAPAAISRSRRFLSGRPKSLLSRRPKTLIGALVVLTAAGGTGAWAATRGGDSATSGGGGARSILATVSAQPIEQTVNASGTIEPASTAEENFAVSGQITSVKVTVGQTVTKGQVLARVDDADLSRAVDIAQANRDAAAAQVTAAADANASATQIDSARAQLATAEDKLAQAKDDLDNATLRATISGTVAAVNFAKGDRVSGSAGGSSRGSSASGAGSGSSSAGIEIVGTKTWEVDASVSGTDLATIKKGQQARITPSGATAPIFGLVDSVGVVASTASGGSSTFPVTIKVTGTPDNLHPGETATVVIVTKSIPDVLTVPTAALREENGQTVVTKVVNGKDTTVPVVVGTAYGANTQVTSGLSDGDQVRVTINRAGPATGNNNRGNGGNRQFGGGGFGGGGFTGGGTFGGGTFTGGTFTGGTFTGGGAFTGRANRGGG
jgi:multidrug efflux pump subunit AcrA (membrane-fusion protein)